MADLTPPQISTIVNVNKAVTTYQRMRAVADARRQAALDVAAELRKLADRIDRLTPSDAELVVAPVELTKLADKLSK